MLSTRSNTTTGLYVAMSLVLIFTLATVGLVGAASTNKALSTNYTLVNLGTSQANVTAQYYLDSGANWPSANTVFQLAANGGQAIVRQYDDAGMPAGRGSAVISSDQPLGSVVQILARNQTPTSGAYVGSSSTGSSYYVPLVLKNRSSASGISNSQIMIQNADSVAVSVTVNLIQGAGSPGSNYTRNFNNIPVGTTRYVDLQEDGGIADQWFGSAVVTAANGRQIAVISNLFAGEHTMQTYNAFNSSVLTNQWFVPLFTSRLANGLSTPVSVQNLSGGSMAIGSITLDCKKDPASPGSNFVLNNTVAVPNNGLHAWNPVTDNSIQALWFGSCRVSAPGNVAVFVQMRQPGFNDNAGAYEAIPANGTNTKMLVPLVAKRLANGFATAVTIQNLSTSLTATVNLTYVPSPQYGGSQTPVNVNGLVIAPGGSLIRNHRLASGSAAETALPDTWFGTLVVQSTGPAIDGFVQLTNINPSAGDTFMAHGVFTQP
jgi:hypothetical protein